MIDRVHGESGHDIEPGYETKDVEEEKFFDDEDISFGFSVGEVTQPDRHSRFETHGSVVVEGAITKGEWARINRFDMATGRYLSKEEWDGLHCSALR